MVPVPNSTVQFIFKFFIVTFSLPVLPKIKQNKFVTFRERKKQGKQFSKLYFYLSPTEHKKATIYCMSQFSNPKPIPEQKPSSTPGFEKPSVDQNELGWQLEYLCKIPYLGQLNSLRLAAGTASDRQLVQESYHN